VAEAQNREMSYMPEGNNLRRKYLSSLLQRAVQTHWSRPLGGRRLPHSHPGKTSWRNPQIEWAARRQRL